jgi:hypothetical protein
LFDRRIEKISSKKVIPEEIERIKLKLFHLFSMVLLKALISSKVMVSRLVLSNISFKGIFPNTVIPKTPIQ